MRGKSSPMPRNLTACARICPSMLLHRSGSGRGIAREIAHGPSHHVQPHLVDVRPFPDVLTMPQAVVEDTPFAVVADPDDGEILVLAMDAFPGQIDLAGIET